MKQNFFVGIKDPVGARRDLLTASKEIIDSLKRFDGFANLYDEKHNYILQLKHTMDELIVLNKKLRNHLPKTPLKAPGVKAPVKKGKKAKSAKGMVAAKSKLELLEDELSKVEARLKTLE